MVCVTRRAEGAVLWHKGKWCEHPGFKVEVRDTVGSGDAFLATLLAGLLDGMEDDELLQRANLMGAYVATQFGVVRAYHSDRISLILAMNARNGEMPAAAHVEHIARGV